MCPRPPPRLVLSAANVLEATEIHTWGCDAATIRWLPPEAGATRLTVVHIKDGGPTYDDALFRLGDIPVAPAPHAPHRPRRRAAPGDRRCDGLRVGWGAIGDSTLLALLRQKITDRCRWDALLPHLTGRHTHMTTPPRGHPRPAWADLIAAFHDHRIFPDDTWQEVRHGTLRRDHRRRVRARLLELRDPLRQGWDELWLSRLGPWSPASHLSHTCHLCGECDVVSSAVLPGCRVPLAWTTRGLSQVHGRGGIALAHRGHVNPLARPRGPRGCRTPLDSRAPAGPHVCRAPVARVRTLTPA